MTQQVFFSRLKILAEVCEFRMSGDLLSLYDRALRRYGYEKAVSAVENAIIERRGNDRMPSIGDLAQRCSPQVLDADTAVEVAGRILAAISRWGYNNGPHAAEWIGEVGWAVVERTGGWEKLCTTVKERDLPTWRAQLRDQALAVLRRQKAGLLDAPPSFGEVGKSQKVAALIGAVVKKSEEYDDRSRDVREVPRAPEPGQFDAEGDAGVA